MTAFCTSCFFMSKFRCLLKIRAGASRGSFWIVAPFLIAWMLLWMVSRSIFWSSLRNELNLWLIYLRRLTWCNNEPQSEERGCSLPCLWTELIFRGWYQEFYPRALSWNLLAVKRMVFIALFGTDPSAHDQDDMDIAPQIQKARGPSYSWMESSSLVLW